MPSEDHLQTLAYQSTSLRNDVNDLERQMMQLQGRLNLAKAESQAKDNELDIEIMARAGIEAREIVQVMFDMLPAELCTHIFSYLIPQNMVEDESMVFAQKFPHTWSISAGPESFDTICWPVSTEMPSSLYIHSENTHPPEYIAPAGRIFRPSFVSEAVALEAAKTYYRGNTFKVVVSVQQDSLRRLLEIDRFKFGLEPFRLIRRLCLVLRSECCHWPRGGNRRARAAPIVGTEELDRLTQYRHDLSTNLAMVPLENRRIMEFTFMVAMTAKSVSPTQPRDEERYFLNMLMCVRGIVYDTKKHGSKTTVCAKLRGSGPVEISTLFPLSVEEWQNESQIPELDAMYIPPSTVPLPADQSVEKLRDRARAFWGYESYEALVVRPSLENMDLNSPFNVPTQYT